MSDNLEKEVEQFKEVLIKQYQANGGKKDLGTFSLSMIQNEIDNQNRVNALKKEIEDLKKSNSVPKDFKFMPVDQGRENAALAKRVAAGIQGTMDYIEPPWNELEIEDERYKRDNAVNVVAPKGEEHSVVILRDKEGRMA